METRTWDLVAKPVKTRKSGGTSCQSSHSPTHLNRYSRTLVREDMVAHWGG